MPLYRYKDEDGNVITKQVPVDERDNQEGLKRIFEFTGMVSSTYGGLK